MPLYREVNAQTFALFFNASRAVSPAIAESCSTFEYLEDRGADWNGARFFLSPSNRSGYCVKRDGELVLVHSLDKGKGNALVVDAVKNGARFLDCFDGYLPTLYGRHGFIEWHREANWDADGPDVVFMKLG
jgi:hypothetical protein